MTQQDRGSLSNRKRRIYDFLQENSVAVLSSVDPNGNPHGVVIYFMVDANFVIHFLTKKGTRKYDDLIHNNHVVLTAFQPQTQTTVQVTGLATEREGRNAIKEISGAIFGATLRTSGSGLPPIVKLQEGNFTTFSIKPIEAHMAVYARPESGTHEELFDSIESFDLEE
jgi:uncharacterized pyridoxamine 5'-phosphate oxidase family protein